MWRRGRRRGKKRKAGKKGGRELEKNKIIGKKEENLIEDEATGPASRLSNKTKHLRKNLKSCVR